METLALNKQNRDTNPILILREESSTETIKRFCVQEDKNKSVAYNARELWRQ